MPTATLTATVVGPPNLQTVLFHVDSTGLPCLDLLTPTTTVTMTNTGTVAHNAFITPYAGRQCNTGEPAFTNFTLVPNVPLSRQLTLTGTTADSLNISAQDVP